VVLLPDVHFGVAGPGCHFPSSDLARDRLYGWEVLLATFFIMVMFAADFVRPGHGDAGPLAAGLALYAILATGGGHWADGLLLVHARHACAVCVDRQPGWLPGLGLAAAGRPVMQPAVLQQC
jgi:hypothetical protein